MKIIVLFGLFTVVFGQHSPYYSTDPEAIRQGFIAADHNHDGILTREEVLEIIRKQDLNGDGFVSYKEYKLTKPSTTPRIVVKGEFRYYDKLDGVSDGKISYSTADGIMNIFDSNKDGRVTLDEFRHNMPQVLDGLTTEINALYVVG